MASHTQVRRLLLGSLFCATALCFELVPGPAGAQEVAALDLRQMTIEQLANVEVTTVTRQPDSLSKAPAAIYVITDEDVHRSGAQDLGDMLRLAPNLQVAQTNSRNYGISARGFNQRDATANKLLVMIDGRTVYSPLFSGTFWDEQNVLPADVDRIEVVSGPGGTLWGANAVNGVINVVTKSSRDTQGTLVSARGGSQDQSLSLQHGGMIDDNISYRVYGVARQYGSTELPNGADAVDAWNLLQSGFRMDWNRYNDTVTVQGDLYRGLGQTPSGSVAKDSISGGNVLARWSERLDDDSEIRIQLYYDKSVRQLVSGINAAVDTADMDAQYSFAIGAHNIVAGAGYRSISDTFKKGPATAELIPARKSQSLVSGFVQDRVALRDDLTLTAGLKLESNVYTGLEYMPDARLAWQLTDADLIWAAVSRAVRTPSRFDRDLFATGLLAGGPNFVSEDLMAYEVGYRGQLLPDMSLSVSAYYNVYDNLRTVEASSAAIYPLQVRNNMRGNTYGIEAWGSYGVADWWRLSAGVNYIHKDLTLKPGNSDVFGLQFPGNDPDYQLSLRSSMNLRSNVTFDLDLRYIPALPAPVIPAYAEANVRLAWQASDAIELFVMGSNLLHARHAEFANPAIGLREIPRTVTAGLNWEF